MPWSLTRKFAMFITSYDDDIHEARKQSPYMYMIYMYGDCCGLHVWPRRFTRMHKANMYDMLTYEYNDHRHIL